MLGCKDGARLGSLVLPVAVDDTGIDVPFWRWGGGEGCTHMRDAACPTGRRWLQLLSDPEFYLAIISVQHFIS